MLAAWMRCNRTTQLFHVMLALCREARTPLRLALVNNRAAAAKILRAHGGVQ
jgi:hypothetical protein